MVPFLEAFKQALRRAGVNPSYSYPNDLAGSYEKLARDCHEEGYDDYLVEYDNDLTVRDFIERVLPDESLQQYPEMKEFMQRIDRADAMLKASFLVGQDRSNKKFWWKRGIVRKGSGDYADDIKLEYGINL
jgi:hypothetical protein